MGLVLIMAFIMSFIQLAFNYTDGFMIHYATFMASRSYLVYDDNSDSEDGADVPAERKAQEVFDKLSYTKRIDANMKVHNPTGGHNEIYTGIYATFDQLVSIINFFGGIKSVKLRSESFLGREPTRGTCAKRICKRMDDEINRRHVPLLERQVLTAI